MTNPACSLNSRRSLIDKGLEGFETGSFGLKVIDPRAIDRASHALEFGPASPRLNGRQKVRAPDSRSATPRASSSRSRGTILP